MEFRGNAVPISAVLAVMLMLASCTQPPTGQDLAAKPQSAASKLEISEISARPAGETSGTAMRPAFPKDVVEIAIKTKGGTAGADLSVKMIALANGATVGVREVRLNPTNSASPSVRFEPTPVWAPGRYLFEVSLEGQLVGTQELEVFPADLAEPAEG